jgi:predicted MFS family arabinose efflux permease
LFNIYRGLPRDAKYLIYSSILPSIAYGMFYTDISYFLTNVQGLPDTNMGLVITIMGISMFISSIPLGIVADKYGRKKMLIGGNIIASLTMVFFVLTTNLAFLAVAAILEGISEGASSVATGALLADKVEVQKRNSAFCLSGFAQSIAFGLGSFAILFVAVFHVFGFVDTESHILLYIILAVLSLLSTLIMLRISESANTSKSKTSIKQFFPQKSKNVLAKYVLASALIAFGAGMVVPLMTRWLNLQYGISDSISGPILGVSSMFIGLATLIAPYLANRMGLVKAVVVTQGVSTLFMFLTPLSPDYFSASFVYTVRAFLMNMSSPLQQSMIMGLVFEDERGAASGVSAALWRLPNALSSYVGAWLMNLRLLFAPFFLATFFYSLSIMTYWIFFRKRKMPEELAS